MDDRLPTMQLNAALSVVQLKDWREHTNPASSRGSGEVVTMVAAVSVEKSCVWAANSAPREPEAAG